MATPLSKQIQDVIDKRFKKVFEQLTNARAMREVGQFAADQIRLRTQLGKGAAKEDGPEGKFLPLAESTKKSRKKKSKLGKLSSNTRPSKSNLTETGKMIEAISVTKAKKESVLIGFKENRSDGMKNAELADIHQNLGASKKKVKRPFFNISAKDKTKILKKIKARIRSLQK